MDISLTTLTSKSPDGDKNMERKKLNLRRKHCGSDCFWRSVDCEANLKPIKFFLINAAPELERWPLEIFRSQCKISR